jgi:hypothetical protein
MRQLIQESTMAQLAQAHSLISDSSKGLTARRLETVLPIVLAMVAVLFATIGMQRSLWLDEANTVLIAARPLSGILQRLRDDNNFPAFYVLLSGWMHVFGMSEIALRALCGLCYLAGGLTTYFLGRTAFENRRVGLYSAFCYLISGQAIRQSENVRVYAFLGLLAAASTLYLFRVLRWRIPRDWLLYVLISAVGILTHVWFFFLMAAQMLCAPLLPRSIRYKVLAAALLAFAPFSLLWFPEFVIQLHGGATNWMPRFHLWFIPDVFAEFYYTPLSTSAGARWPIVAAFFYLGCAILILPGLWRYLRRDGLEAVGEDDPSPSSSSRAKLFLTYTFASTKQRPALLLLLLTLFAIAIPLFVTFFKPIYWPARYTMIALPTLAVLLGWALARFAPRPLLLTFCAIMLALTAAGRIITHDEIPELRELRQAQGYSDRYTAQYILEHAQPGDALVFTSLSRAGIDYYLLKNRSANRFHEFSFPLETAEHLGWRDPEALLRNPDLLERESASVESKLAAETANGSARIWLFWGEDQPVNEFLAKQLQKQFAVQQILDLRGSYYRRVLVLTPADGRGGANSMPAYETNADGSDPFALQTQPTKASPVGRPR